MSGLRNPVIGGAEFAGDGVESQVPCPQFNLPVFGSSQKLGDILNQEHGCPGEIHKIEKRAPQLFTRIAEPVFVQQTESLTGRTADYYIDPGYLRSVLFQVGQNILRDAVRAEVIVVGLYRFGIIVDGEYRSKFSGRQPGKSEGQSSGAGEQVGKSIFESVHRWDIIRSSEQKSSVLPLSGPDHNVIYLLYPFSTIPSKTEYDAIN